MGLFISVVVCTFNRSNLLSGCLESLCNQTLDKSKFEIIVVDNNSTDHTAEVANSFLTVGNVHYVLETNPGLSYARNRGTLEAVGQYVAFIDDDAKADPNWLEVAYDLLQSTQPRLDCLGGPCHPFYPKDKPDWFKDQYEIRGFGNSPKYLSKYEQLSGSNMVWEKESLIRIGMFDVNLGVVKNQLKLGEETAAFEKLWSLPNQPNTYYSPDLIIYHLVPEIKMSVSYRLKRKFAQGQYQAYMIGSISYIKKIAAICESLFAVSKKSLRFVLKFKSHSHWQNWVAEDGGMIAYDFGRLLGYIGIKPKIIQDA